MTPGSKVNRQPAGGHPGTPRAVFLRAWSLWVLTIAVTVSVLIYNHVHPLPPELSGGTGNALAGTVAVTFIAGFATVGALLGWKRPANPIGWLLSGTSLSYTCASVGLLLLQFPAARAWGNWTSWMYLLGLALVVFVLLLFPTGSLPSRRWRPVAWAGVAAIAAWALGNLSLPRSSRPGRRRCATPWGWPGWPGTSSASWLRRARR
jgi:hypothetical protein